MSIIKIMMHPTLGRCYLFSVGQLCYSLGKVDTTYMKFDGYIMDEVLGRAADKGFVPVN